MATLTVYGNALAAGCLFLHAVWWHDKTDRFFHRMEPLKMNDSNLAERACQNAKYRVPETENGKVLQFNDNPTAYVSHVRIDDPDDMAPYVKTMLMPLAFIDVPRSAILIGLGEGAMVKFVHRCVPEMRMVALEVVPEVVDLARKHFAVPPNDERLHVVVGDGVKYMVQHSREGQTDLILLDAFGDQHCMIDEMHTPEFYEACYRALRPGGVMTVNVLKPTVEWAAAFTRMLPEIFTDIHFDITDPSQGVLTLWKERKAPQWGSVARRAARFDGAVGANSVDLADTIEFVELAKTMSDRYVRRS